MQVLDFLESTRLGRDRLLDWLLALGIAVAVQAVFVLVRRIVVRRLGRIAARTATAWDDFAVDLVRRTRWLLVAPLAFFLGSLHLRLPSEAAALLKGAAALAVFFQVGLWGSLAIDFRVGRTRAKRLADNAGATTLLGLLGFAGKAALWTFLLILALDNFGVNVTALVAGLGVGGIAIALAVQNILGDVLASLSIVLDKPFVVGDSITVGELSGKVEHIGLKTTRLRNLSGEEVVLPNGELLKSRIHNWHRMSERRMVFSLGVVYGTPVDQLQAIPEAVRAVIEGIEGVRFDRVHLARLSASSIDFDAVYWVRSPEIADALDRQQRVLLGVLTTLADKGVAIAYPTQTVIVSGQLQPGDGVNPR